MYGDGKARLTPFTILLPTLVMKPLILSDRKEDKTKVEPGSLGANKATHSSNPSLSEASDSCRDSSSHCSSLA